MRCLTIFLVSTPVDKLSAFFPPPVSTCGFFRMATTRKNSCSSDVATAPQPSGGTALQNASDLPSPETLLQEYKQLRERFQRTANALGSAAHDLKTPLSILNGYVDLLRSEKLGPLNDRQREILVDMRDSGKRLQQFIQDFLTYSALETGGVRMQFLMGKINDWLSGGCPPGGERLSQKRNTPFFFGDEKTPPF